MRKILATMMTIVMLVFAGATLVPLDGQDGSGQTVLLGYPGIPIVPFDGQDGSGQ